MGWPCAYEPSRLGGWEPDFRLARRDGGYIWIEIKPGSPGEFDAPQRSRGGGAVSVREKMLGARVNNRRDLLAFCYREPVLSEPVCHFGWVAIWSALLDEDGYDWWWQDAALWYCEPLDRWGLAAMQANVELMLAPEEVAQNGGIAL